METEKANILWNEKDIHWTDRIQHEFDSLEKKMESYSEEDKKIALDFLLFWKRWLMHDIHYNIPVQERIDKIIQRLQ